MRLLVKNWQWVLPLGLLSLLIRAICFTGLVGSDDLGYYHYAHLLSQHLYFPELHHYAIRYGLTIPVAFVYGVFGTTEWTTEVVPYVASVASVLVLVVIGNKLFGFRAGMIAGLLLATFPLSIRFATILVPESVAEIYVLIAIALYLYAEGQYSLVFAMASGIFLAFAYLAKEWTVFVVPAVLIDAVAERRWRVCFGVAAGATAIVAVEHIYYLASTGDLLFRAHALAHATKDPSAIEENRNLFRRLFTHYPKMMLMPGRNFGLHSCFALVLVPAAFFTVRWRQLRLLILWALLPFLYLDFGSMSFSHYVAVFSQPRYLEIIYPPLFLMAGAVIDRSAARGGRTLSLIALPVVAVIGCYCAFLTRATGFGTHHVAAIRSIVKDARDRHLTTIRFEVPGKNLEDQGRMESKPLRSRPPSDDLIDRWRTIMSILAPEIQSTNAGQYDMLVRPNALGVPTIVGSDHSR